jgi:hypothetical protein
MSGIDMLDRLYKETLENPNTSPETMKWLVDFLDAKAKPKLSPEDMKPPLRYYPDGELMRFLSDGSLAPKRNIVGESHKL